MSVSTSKQARLPHGFCSVVAKLAYLTVDSRLRGNGGKLTLLKQAQNAVDGRSLLSLFHDRTRRFWDGRL